MSKRFNAAELRAMKAANLKFPEHLIQIPTDQWVGKAMMVFGTKEVLIQVWRSRKFLVQIFEEPNHMIRMSVQRTEWDERQQRFRADIAWEDLQDLKTQVGYGDRVGVEVFPPDDLIVNVANMRHVWILEPGSEKLPFVWKNTAP